MPGRTGPGWSLSLVIPAYNEEAGIAAAVAEADDALARLADDYEVIVVDDGSRDATFAAAAEAARSRPHVRVLRYAANRGYGAALRTGFEAARCDRVAFTDADCQFDLADLARLAPEADRVPVVAGYRIDRKDPWRRRFLSRGYNLLARTLLGTRVRDCDCALKVFRRTELAHLLPESTNFFVNTEMLTRARQRGYAVAEVGVTHRPRRHGISKVSMTDVPKTLATLLPFWWSRVAFPGAAGERRGGWLGLLLVLAVAALLFFSRLGTPLLEPEEARYAEIPRQMLADGHWLVPHAHGQPYLDKPPLLYWLVMASYSAFGVHDWAARLVPGLCGWLTVAAAYLWARRTAGSRAALVGALVLCLSAKFIYFGRMLSMNGPLALWTTAALALAHSAMLPDARRRGWLWLLAGGAVGLGLMAKGPVAWALVAPPLLVAGLIDPRLRRPTLGHALLFAAAALTVATPWYVAVARAEPEFLRYFFWFHNVTRFAQPFDHAGPVWQYLPGLLAGLLPWSLLLVPMLRFLARKSARTAARRPAALGVFLLAFAWGLLFFSLAGSKRPAYLVPLLPPLALAVGCYLNAVLPRERLADAWAALARYRSRLAYGVATVALAAGVVGGLATLSAGTRQPDRAVFVAGACGLALAVVLTRSRRYRASWLTAGVATFAVLLAGVDGLLPAYARRFSLRHPVRMQLTPDRAAHAVFCYPHRWDSVSFYTGRPDVTAFDRGRRDDLIRALGDQRAALLFIQTKYLGEVVGELPPDLEFLPRQHDGGVTVGEVRPRREAPPQLARR